MLGDNVQGHPHELLSRSSFESSKEFLLFLLGPCVRDAARTRSQNSWYSSRIIKMRACQAQAGVRVPNSHRYS